MSIGKVCAVGLAVAALLASASCGTVRAPEPSPPPAPSQSSRSTTETATSDGLTLTLAIPSARLEAGTTQKASVTLTNSSRAAIEIIGDLGIRIRDESGEVVFDSERARSRRRHPMNQFPLAPGEDVGQAILFEVPPAGSYVIEASGHRVGGAVPVSRLHFVSF